MKTIKLIICVLLMSSFANAQELTSKKGIPILPQKGDWGVGVNAKPFLNYVGNIFNGSTNNSTNFNLINANTLMGKYYLTDTKALRFKFCLNTQNETLKNNVKKDGQNNFEITVTDINNHSYTNIMLSAGLEKRKGYGRLQGFYGSELALSFFNESNSYKYGNSFDSTNVTPLSTTSFSSHLSNSSAIRTINRKTGLGFGVSVRGFVGVEYFIAPKISLGGEFGYAVSFTYNNGYKEKDELWDSAKKTAKTFVEEKGGSMKINTNADDFGGAIFLMIHF